MKFQTHIIGGITLGLLASYTLNYSATDTLFYYGALTLGSLLPDIDHPKSFIGRKILPISKVIHKLIGHRTFTHSLFVVLIGLEGCRLTEYNPIVVGITLGIISHILLDSFTAGGVALFYPISKKRHKFIFK